MYRLYALYFSIDCVVDHLYIFGVTFVNNQYAYILLYPYIPHSLNRIMVEYTTPIKKRQTKRLQSTLPRTRTEATATSR